MYLSEAQSDQWTIKGQLLWMHIGANRWAFWSSWTLSLTRGSCHGECVQGGKTERESLCVLVERQVQGPVHSQSWDVIRRFI